MQYADADSVNRPYLACTAWYGLDTWQSLTRVNPAHWQMLQNCAYAASVIEVGMRDEQVVNRSNAATPQVRQYGTRSRTATATKCRTCVVQKGFALCPYDDAQPLADIEYRNFDTSLVRCGGTKQ